MKNLRKIKDGNIKFLLLAFILNECHLLLKTGMIEYIKNFNNK